MIKIAKLSTSPEYFKWDFIKKSNFCIDSYITGKETLYDADCCGDEVVYWVVVTDGDPIFYRCYHSWWWHNYGLDNSELRNEFGVIEIDKDNLDDEAKANIRFVI